jgi:hypothetical protein
MTLRALTLGEVEYHPLQAAHVEIVDKLNQAHGVYDGANRIANADLIWAIISTGPLG